MVCFFSGNNSTLSNIYRFMICIHITLRHAWRRKDSPRVTKPMQRFTPQSLCNIFEKARDISPCAEIHHAPWKLAQSCVISDCAAIQSGPWVAIEWWRGDSLSAMESGTESKAKWLFKKPHRENGSKIHSAPRIRAQSITVPSAPWNRSRAKYLCAEPEYELIKKTTMKNLII
jgi:hypothetical protein